MSFIKTLTLFLFVAFGSSLAIGQTIAGGGYSSLALKEDGTVAAWGMNRHKQCDVPSGLKDVVAIAAGDFHSLALKEDGAAVVWGDNTSGQHVQSGLKDVVAIAAGGSYSLALKEDGTVVAWGRSYNNQCDVPGGLRDVVAITTGRYHSIALKEDGTVAAWGGNDYKQCDVPGGLKDVVAIAAGGLHSLALKEDGTVVAWGKNLDNQCDVPGGLRDVVAIAAGGLHSLALKEDGTVAAWGGNKYTQCDVPILLNDVVAIAAGNLHSLVLKEDGTVVAWGSPQYGRCSVPSGLKAALPKRKKISFSNKPPILSIQPSTIGFFDSNQNKALDAFEEAEVRFELTNSGPGTGRRLAADVNVTGSTSGVVYEKQHSITDIASNETAEVSIPIAASRHSMDGSIQIRVEVVEPNGFNPEPFTIEIETRAFLAPKLEVVDFSSSLPTWKPNTSIGLDVLIQNTGVGVAEDLKMELTLPKAVNCYSSNTSIQVPVLAAGETLTITYDMIVPRNFSQKSIQASLTVTEKFDDYGTSWSRKFPFTGGSNNENVIAIDAMAEGSMTSTERASLVKSNSGAGEVTFNRTGKEHNITAVAVIGKMVTDCGGNSKAADELASYTENNILAHYDVIERRHFEDILNEHRIQMSGLTFEETLIKNGCIENAQGYIFVESGCLMGDEMIQLKLVHCESSDLVWSCTGVNATAKETLDKLIEELQKAKE